MESFILSESIIDDVDSSYLDGNIDSNIDVLDRYLNNALNEISAGLYRNYPSSPILEDITLEYIIDQFNKLGFDSICINPTWIEGNAYIYANGYVDPYGYLHQGDLKRGPLDINQSGIE